MQAITILGGPITLARLPADADTLCGTLVPDQACQTSWNLAVTASGTAAGHASGPG
jgi:hypothetical protein